MDIYAWILTLAIIIGQLIRLPVGTQGGITILDTVVILLCGLGLLKLRFQLKKPPLFITGALFFILIALFSLALTPLNLQPIEYFTSFLYSIRFTAYVFLGWLIFSGVFPTLKDKVPQVFLFSGIFLAILGLVQFVFLPDLRFLIQEGWDPHYFRTVSTFLDPNFTGAFLVLTMILLTYLRCVRIPHQVWVRLTPKVFYVTFTIVYLALLTTFSRSSYLMFLVSGLTFSFLKKSKSLGLSTLLLFVILLAGFQIYSNLVATPRNIDREQSASARLNTWQQGLYLLQKFPLLGVGFNAYRYGLKEFNLGDEQFLKSHGSSSNDSSLLFVAATTGIAGLLVYIYFLFILLRSNYPQYGHIIIPAVLGLLVHSFFANSLFYPPILLWILLTSVGPRK